MKQSFIYISLLTLSMLFASCSNNHTASAVALDNGSKWTANPETTTGINNMITLMDAFTAKEDTKAYQQLVSSLSDEFQMIFKKCTMEGEAHNQLHNFLFPMKDLFDKLKSTELSEQKIGFEELKTHLIRYPDYFQ